MANEHLRLDVDDAAGVHDEAGCDLGTELVFAFDRVGVVQVRDRLKRLGAGRFDIDDAAAEARRLRQLAGHLVVDHVIGRAQREDDLRADLPYQRNRFHQRGPVVQDKGIVAFEAVILTAEEADRLGGLALANPADLFPAVLDGAAIARRERCDVDFPASLAEQGQGPGAHELGVVRMGAETQDNLVVPHGSSRRSFGRFTCPSGG